MMNECDVCTERNVGYDRAIAVLVSEVKHLLNIHADDGYVQGFNHAIEELQKER